MVSKINSGPQGLTYWGRVAHISVSKHIIIGSDNGLSPERRQAIIWTNAAILLIGPLGTNFSEILIVIQTFSLKKICLKLLSAKCCSFRPGLNELIPCQEVVQVVCYQGTPMTPWAGAWGLCLYRASWDCVQQLPLINSLAPGRCSCVITHISWVFLVKLPLKLSNISEYWFKYWLGAVRQQISHYQNQFRSRFMMPYYQATMNLHWPPGKSDYLLAT